MTFPLSLIMAFPAGCHVISTFLSYETAFMGWILWDVRAVWIFMGYERSMDFTRYEKYGLFAPGINASGILGVACEHKWCGAYFWVANTRAREQHALL